MAEKKTIAVVGATGAQGGGLVRAILKDPGAGFAVRALTRNPRSEKAKALAAQGAEVAAADLDDVESLTRAFAGCHGAFCLTNFWEHFSPEKELAQAANMAQAAKAAGVEHVVWSTLEDTRRWVPLEDPRMPTLMGKYKVPHFDAKGEADALFTKAGVPTTFLLTSFYWDNLIHFGMGPKKGPDGPLVFTLPMGDKPLPGIAAEDIGACCLGLLAKGREYIGKTVGIAGEHLTGQAMADAMARALGAPVRYQALSFEAYRKLGFPGADDLGNMFQFKHNFNDLFCGARNPAVARSLYPGLQTFAQWLDRNKSRIPLG
jgi:uncharacterized protein YbjT (DUF2867 family)